jgi:hypothetical protein
MTITVTDQQIVGETSSTLFSFIQQGPVAALVILKNDGVNTMNYRVQQYTGTAWEDMGASGTDYYNTLALNEVKSFKITSSYPQVRVVGNASGGASLSFDVMRHVERPSGGSIPILNL